MTGTFALYWRGGWSFFCVIICIISLGGTTLRRKPNLFFSQNSIHGTKKSPQGLWHVCGADEGSRTLLSSLGSWRSTDELHPHDENIFFACIDNTTLFPNFPAFLITFSKENGSHDLSSFHIIFLKIRCDKV